MKQIANKLNLRKWKSGTYKSKYETYLKIMNQMVKHKRGIDFYIFKMHKLDVEAIEGFMNRTKDPNQVNVESRIPFNYSGINEDNILKEYFDKCFPNFKKYYRQKESIRNIREKKGLCKLCTNKFIYTNYPCWRTHFLRKHKEEYEEIRKQQSIPTSIYFDPID